MTQAEQLLSAEFDTARPDIISALKLKLDMIRREQDTARIYGRNDAGNMLHLNYLAAESIKTQQLIKKLETK